MDPVELLNNLPPEFRARVLGAFGRIIGSAFRPFEAWFDAKAKRISAAAEMEAIAQRLDAVRKLSPTSQEP